MDSARGAAHAVTEFFQGNPFSTRVGAQIEHATNPNLDGENWALNIAICDLVNSSEEGPRDAIRAIRKRLKDNMGRNNPVIMKTLTVLETCVKNCDRRFHQAVSQKEFVQELVKLIGPKYDPPQEAQERVLSLIQCWADAFRGQSDLKGVCEMYEELKSKGVEFPMTDLDSMAPIYTPKKSIQPPANSPKPPQQQVPSQQPQRRQVPADSGPIHLSPEQLAKLRSELDVVTGNIGVLQEMLSELHPGQEDTDDLQLLRDLYKTCRHMQKRILELVECVANEEVTSDLLMINDELNNAFNKYDRYMNNRKKENNSGKIRAATAVSPPAAAASTSVADSSPPLIDFGSSANDSANLSQKLAEMSVNGTNVGGLPQTTAVSTEFDMFSQARGASLEHSRQSGSTYYDNSAGLDQTGMGLGAVAQQRSQLYSTDTAANTTQKQSAAMKESDYEEMEEWLKQQADSAKDTGNQQTDEFEQFLSGRVEQNAGASTGLTSQPQQDQQQPSNKDERLFSL